MLSNCSGYSRLLRAHAVHTTDDEPEDGPDYYFVVSGFANVEFFSQLAPLGISAKALCKVHTYVRTLFAAAMYVRTCIVWYSFPSFLRSLC